MLSPSNGPLELRRLGISPYLSALVGTLQQLPRRPMATEARDLYAMLQVVFAQGPVRTRLAYLTHPRRRLPRVRGLVRSSKP